MSRLLGKSRKIGLMTEAVKAAMVEAMVEKAAKAEAVDPEAEGLAADLE